jgi:hypothetical protein
VRARTRTAVTTLALAAVAAAAVAGAILGVGRQERAEQSRRDAAERVFAFAPADVREVEVRSDRGEVVAARAGAGWKLVRPAPAEADSGAVDLLVERLAGLRRKGEVASASDAGGQLSRFGLDHPFLTVTARLRDGRAETLLIGRTNGFDDSHYARAGAGPVVLISPSDRHLLDRTAEELTARAPIPAPAPTPQAAAPARSR